MRKKQLRAHLALGAAVLGTVFLASNGASAQPPAAPTTGNIVNLPIAFEVINSNTSKVACPSDGAPYIIRGHLVASRAALENAHAKAATLYLHGFDAGEWFWNFSAVAGYDYALEMAQAGHVSIVIDRLGYVSSDRPDGVRTCLGAQADMAHQIVGQLRSGAYTLGGHSPVAFSDIVLAGHSIGGSIAQIEAYSYKDIDGLAVFGYADQGSSQSSQVSLGQALGVCARGGEGATAGDRPGYAYFIQTEEESRAGLYQDAEPQVIDAATALRTTNPCGDLGTILAANVTNRLSLSQVQVPVLLVYGSHDKTFPVEGGRQQRDRFTGTSDVTFVVLDNTGHFFTMEKTVPTFRQHVSDWLVQHGFSGLPSMRRP